MSIIDLSAIRHSSNEAKIQLISSVLSSNKIPIEINTRQTCTTEKFFYVIEDGERRKRSWLLFKNQKFYCVYCLCFASKNDMCFVLGVEHDRRLIYKLNLHEKALQHSKAKDYYSQITSQLTPQLTPQLTHGIQMEKWNAVKSIIEIIIFIATHSKHIRNERELDNK